MTVPERQISVPDFEGMGIAYRHHTIPTMSMFFGPSAYLSHVLLSQNRLHWSEYLGARNRILCHIASCSQCRDLSTFSRLISRRTANSHFLFQSTEQKCQTSVIVVESALSLEGGLRTLEHALELKHWLGGREDRHKEENYLGPFCNGSNQVLEAEGG